MKRTDEIRAGGFDHFWSRRHARRFKRSIAKSENGKKMTAMHAVAEALAGLLDEVGLERIPSADADSEIVCYYCDLAISALNKVKESYGYISGNGHGNVENVDLDGIEKP